MLVERDSCPLRVVVQLLEIGPDERVLDCGASAADDDQAAGALHGNRRRLAVLLYEPACSVDEFLLGVLALINRVQADEQTAGVGLPEPASATTRDRQGVRHAGDLVADILRNPIHEGPCGRQAGSHRQAHRNLEAGFVLVWCEIDARHPVEGEHRRDDHRARADDEPAVRHREGQHPCVGVVDVTVEPPA